MEIIKSILDCLFFVGMGVLICHAFRHQDRLRAWEDRQIARAKAFLRYLRVDLTARIANKTLQQIRKRKHNDRGSYLNSDYRSFQTAGRRADAEMDLLRLIREVESQK